MKEDTMNLEEDKNEWKVESVETLTKEQQDEYLEKLLEQKDQELEKLEETKLRADVEKTMGLIWRIGLTLSSIGFLVGTISGVFDLVVPIGVPIAGLAGILGVPLFTLMGDSLGFSSIKEELLISKEAKQQILALKEEIKPLRKKAELKRKIKEAKKEIKYQEEKLKEEKEILKLKEQLKETKKQVNSVKNKR